MYQNHCGNSIHNLSIQIPERIIPWILHQFDEVMFFVLFFGFNLTLNLFH